MFTILIADDETAVRDNMINSVDWDSLGLKIIGVADNGLTAYDYISVHQPDLALIDIRMPGMSGIDIIRRAAEENIRTRFIIISGFDRFEYAQKALEYHAFKYLLKPFSHQELTDSLRAAVEALPTLANRSGVSGLLGSAVPNNAQIVYPHECEHAILRGITACSDAQELRALVHAFICAAQRKNDSDQAVLHCVMIIYIEICKTMMQYGHTISPENFMNLSAESRSVVESVEMALLDTCLEACSMLECASRSNQLVRIAMHYIEDHYSEKLSLDEIAKQIHISPVYLSNLFTKETGQSITQYIQIQRIEHAKTMLANSMDSIDCISEGVGYSNTKYFIKVFKRMTGITPAAYRSQAAVPPRHAK